MKILSLISGTLAVLLFLGSYQLKSRKNIIFCNTLSRILYILQYILLGEFIGAVMDVSAIPSSVLAEKKENPIVKRYRIPIIIAVNFLIVALGAAFWENALSLLPIFGVLFETVALWFSRERTVRLMSLLGAPFWLSYNLICGAYASAIGNVLTIISILTALYRYRTGKCEKSAESVNNLEREEKI